MRHTKQQELFETKTCRICKEEKPLSNFYLRKDTKTPSYRTECNSCLRIIKGQTTIGSNEHVRCLLRECKTRSERKNTFCNLEKADIKELMTNTCPVLGIELIIGTEEWGNSPTIDRIDNTKGYVKGNIIVVSMLANCIKNQATPDQILTVGKYYKKLYKEKGINYA